MKVAIIGRTEILFETIELFLKSGYEIPLIITSKEAPEYTKTSKDFENIANKIGAKYIYTNRLDECKDEMKKAGWKTESGIFGADMKVSLINDGPVTLVFDSKTKQ